MNKKVSNGITVSLVLGVMMGWMFVGCRPQSTYAPTLTLEVESDPWVDIQGVKVIEGEAIEFWGQTNLSEEDCLYTQLFDESLPVAWWPVGKCFPISDQDWYFRVTFGVDGVPEELSVDVQYQIRVWWPGASETAVDQIYFDLASPPAN